METRKKRWVLGIHAAGYGVIALMVHVIGNSGMAYLGTALACCLLPEALLFLCLPAYVEKMLRSRVQKSQYKNAAVVWKTALFYALLIGTAGCILLLFCADAVCGSLLGMGEAGYALKLLAPVFLLDAVCAVFQGFFQGNGTAMPTVVSAVLRQLMNLTFGMLFGNGMQKYGRKAAALLHNENFTFMYGAAGAAAGILLAAFLELLFLLLIYFGAGRRMLRNKREGLRLSEDGTQVLGQLVRLLLPLGVCHALLHACGLTGLGIFTARNGQMSLSELGVYYAQALLPGGIVCTLALCLAVGAEAAVIRAYRAEESKNARSFLNGGMQGIWMFSLFFSAMGFVLSPYLTVDGEKTAAAVRFVRHGMLFPVLLSMGLYFVNILWELERRRTVLLSFGAAFAGSVCTVLICNAVAKGDPVLMMYVWNVFALLLCAVNGFVLLKMTRSDPEWIRQFFMPFFVAAITGLCIFLLSRALYSLLGELLTGIIGALTGCFCYVILLFVFQCIREKDLYYLPGGGLLRRIGNFLHLL